jgi:hypothetical protein
VEKFFYIAALLTAPFIVSAKDSIPSGMYLELFLGAKAGGGSNHQELVTKLKKGQISARL